MSEDILVGRQPIYNSQLNIVAYELLFRSSKSHQTANFEDGDKATSKLILNTFLDFGLDNLVGKLPAYINMTRNFLLGNKVMPLDKEQVVLEILEDVEIDDEVINAVKSLSEQGYTIALDDFIFDETHKQILPYINIIKIDILNLSNDEIKQQIETITPLFKGILLAEKIETQDEFDFCASLDFEYFQGFFLSKPRVMSRQRIPTNQLAILNLLTKLYKENTTVSDLEENIANDLSLSYRLMRYINSSFFGLKTRIESVHHALALLGLDNIRRWVSLIALTGANDKPNHIVTTSLIRAKMCASMAEKKSADNANQYFTAGLFSNLPALLDLPIEEIINDLALSPNIKDALLKREGEIGSILQCCIDYEQLVWDKLDRSGLDSNTINDCYIDAIAWADSVMEEIKE